MSAASLLQATPYASRVTLSGSTVSFILNQPTASLTYSINGGAPVALDGSTQGSKTFNLGSPTDHFSIMAQNNDATGFLIPTGSIMPVVSSIGLSQPTNQSGTKFISDDASPFSRYNSPRGVSVNTNPNSPYFGIAYISNSATGPVVGGNVVGPGNTPPNAFRTLVGKGLYALNADESDAFGNGDTGVNPLNIDGFPAFAFTGNSFGTAVTNSPYRIRVGTDGTIWAADYSDANGQLFQVQPNLTGGVTTSVNILAGSGGPPPPADGSGTPTSTDATGLGPDPACAAGKCTSTFQNHGSISSSWTTGSLAAGNLVVYTLDEDLDSAHFGGTGANNKLDRNSIWKYSIGSTIPSSGFNGTPTQLAPGVPSPAAPGVANGLIGDFPPGGLITDMTRGPDGKFYLSQNRSSGGQPGILVYDSTGTTLLFNSLDASRTLLNNPNAADIFTGVGGIDISPDGKWLATMEIDNDVALIPLVAGIPDIAHRLLMDGGTNTGNGRDISFDAAGNLYTVSSGQGMYRVYSPGGKTLAITSWDGSSFSFAVVPEPTSCGLILLALAMSLCAGPKRRDW